MTIPQTIPITSIDLGVRGRTTYHGIEELAESISHNGLIQPLVLGLATPTLSNGEAIGLFDDLKPYKTSYPLLAGGRRFHALLHLGVTELHHAVTSTPGSYGFLLKGEAGTELSNLLTEIAENRDREDVDWRDELKMIVRAGRMVVRDGFSHGVKILQRDLGSILGCNYNDINTAFQVYDDLIACPEDYKDVSGLRASLAVLLKKNQRFLESLQVERSFVTNRVQSESKLEGGDASATDTITGRKSISATDQGDVVVSLATTIPLTSHFTNENGIDWLTRNERSVDHIICDPDFAVSKERLSAGTSGVAEGVVQDSVETSLADLETFIHCSFHAMRDRGFLVFFLDLDHWEKCLAWTTFAGFATQRWPFIWHKTDYRSNASPQSNTCKNMEYAMICRKPGTVFAASPQMSSIFACPSGNTTKDFGHPFAKPKELWTKLFSMCCIKGQRVEDPFMGSGSSSVTAVEYGLSAVGQEIQTQHYNSAVLNLQRTYRKLLGEGTQFE